MIRLGTFGVVNFVLRVKIWINWELTLRLVHLFNLNVKLCLSFCQDLSVLMLLQADILLFYLLLLVFRSPLYHRLRMDSSVESLRIYRSVWLFFWFLLQIYLGASVELSCSDCLFEPLLFCERILHIGVLFPLLVGEFPFLGRIMGIDTPSQLDLSLSNTP